MPKNDAYHVKKAGYMRRKRAVYSIVNLMIANAIRFGEARGRCRDINQELGLDSLAVSLINDVINQCKLEIADSKIDENCQTDIITDVATQTKADDIDKRKNQADYMRLHRQRLKYADPE